MGRLVQYCCHYKQQNILRENLMNMCFSDKLQDVSDAKLRKTHKQQTSKKCVFWKGQKNLGIWRKLVGRSAIANSFYFRP